MHLRETKRRDLDGSTVAYLSLARSDRYSVVGGAESATGSSCRITMMGDHAGELQR
jgi:hypothetical protein